MRIAIIGNSGSGKSTLALDFAGTSGAALLDLDTIAWEPGQIAVARAIKAAVADVDSFCASSDHWVVEGCYADLVAATFVHAPYLLFLDPGMEQCVANCKARPWEPHKYQSRAEQDERLGFLLSWVAEYYTREGDTSLKAHEALFASYAGKKTRLTTLPGKDFVLRLLEENDGEYSLP